MADLVESEQQEPESGAGDLAIVADPAAEAPAPAPATVADLDTESSKDDLATTIEPEPGAITLTHVVTRPFIGDGIERVMGEVVDATSWRMAEHLVNGRRLRVLRRGEPQPVDDGRGRYFIDDDSLLAYIEASVEDDVSDPHEET